jgi:hypothetical protein
MVTVTGPLNLRRDHRRRVAHRRSVSGSISHVWVELVTVLKRNASWQDEYGNTAIRN